MDYKTNTDSKFNSICIIYSNFPKTILEIMINVFVFCYCRNLLTRLPKLILTIYTVYLYKTKIHSQRHIFKTN